MFLTKQIECFFFGHKLIKLNLKMFIRTVPVTCFINWSTLSSQSGVLSSEYARQQVLKASNDNGGGSLKASERCIKSSGCGNSWKYVQQLNHFCYFKTSVIRITISLKYNVHICTIFQLEDQPKDSAFKDPISNLHF